MMLEEGLTLADTDLKNTDDWRIDAMNELSLFLLRD